VRTTECTSDRTPTLGSVLIPAHNEATVVGRCLRALLDGSARGALEVVVVCNGCTDGTAQVVRSCADEVLVVELDQASKPQALRAGEGRLTGFPRLYLDADVVLPHGSAVELLMRLSRGPALAVRPPVRYEAANSSPIVKRYYAARRRLPAVTGALWGSGVYGLSEEGRRRFGAYPDAIADELFVARHFAEHEIEVVDCPPAVVTVPRKTVDLLRVLRRTYRGNTELKTPGPGSTPVTARDILDLALTGPRPAVDALTYSALAVGGRLMTRVAGSGPWERDESSRIS